MIGLTPGGDAHILIETPQEVSEGSQGSGGSGTLGGSGNLRGSGPLRRGGVRLGVAAALVGRRVRGISAGPGFALVVTEAGELWAWGANESGQLGRRPSEPPLLAFRRLIPEVGVYLNFRARGGL